MAIVRLNPEKLHATAGYAHVTLVDAGRLAVLAGQCPLDHCGNLVGRGDVLGQVDQIATNVTETLAAAGTSADHVIRSVIYVVSDDPDVLASVWDRLTASSIGAAFTTAGTLLGVAALGYRDQLVEVDLTAALP
ncbi:RidA family protein [Spelaeicoccus albus]|uniref:Enamine deaminase RidA (YjgF/YER057c/UK114 family) n=1 Tax=Spelaeicoccus albus TaxID=1280376 RepID=A0A7Z0IJ43_9MICO|nr:RidA family protein [Spelaeicoccus albus]NYI69138.1 enamine deaminase RidA (YjgF/YER057c/UK114 family) [Spelaeicoccus albus]